MMVRKMRINEDMATVRLDENVVIMAKERCARPDIG